MREIENKLLLSHTFITSAPMFDHTSLMKPTDDTTCVNDVICLTENIYQDRMHQAFDIKHFGPSNLPTDDPTLVPTCVNKLV